MCETSRLLIFLKTSKKNSLAFTSQWDRLFCATNLTKCQPFSFGSKKQTCQSKPLAFLFVHVMCHLARADDTIFWHVANFMPSTPNTQNWAPVRVQEVLACPSNHKEMMEQFGKKHNDFQEVTPKKMCSPFVVEGQLHVSVLPN